VQAVNAWFASLGSALEGSIALSVGAAAILGALSVVISPCHLAGVPLVVGVVQAHRGPKRSALSVALLFGLGVLLSFVIVGGATVALGRIAGDLGRFGNLLGAAVFIAFGLQLLEVVEIPWFKSLTTRVEGRTARPTLVGFLFGASLGPCTFSFMAPAIGVAVSISRSAPIHAALLLASFALAHTAVVTAAGVFGGATERFLDSRGATRAAAFFRRATGVLLILGGFYFLYSMR
jgi:cytochrome c-type biogenesis protein